MRNRAIKGCLIVVFATFLVLLENIGGVAKNRVTKPQAETEQSQQIPEADKRGTLEARRSGRLFCVTRFTSRRASIKVRKH